MLRVILPYHRLPKAVDLAEKPGVHRQLCKRALRNMERLLYNRVTPAIARRLIASSIEEQLMGFLLAGQNKEDLRLGTKMHSSGSVCPGCILRTLGRLAQKKSESPRRLVNSFLPRPQDFEALIFTSQRDAAMDDVGTHLGRRLDACRLGRNLRLCRHK